MKVLLTGAFGNIGTSTLDELLDRRHTVRCFDLPSRANRRAARSYKGRIEMVWGDLRRLGDAAQAVRGQDVILHLAFVIPKMSATGVESESRPEWARQINVGGTRNLLQAARALPEPPRFLFTSSYHVYGRTQHELPPRTTSDPVRPVEHYSRHKVFCEQMVRGSGLEWAILRLSATLPLKLHMDPGMFDVPLDNRMEFTHTRDVAIALANALQRDEVWRATWLIGGGLRCQYLYREIVSRNLEALGVGMLPDEAFGKTPFPTDWMDTVASQQVLGYQERDLEDYVRDMKVVMGPRRHFVRLFRPLVRRFLLNKSPYYRQSKERDKPVRGAAEVLA